MRDSGFIDHWNGTYLTSNTVWQEADNNKPLGSRYTYIQAGSHRLLAFGFLYNFTGNCAATRVVAVQEAVRQEWFVNALLQQNGGGHHHVNLSDTTRSNKYHYYDAILVMAHMDCEDELIGQILLPAIRARTNKPVQFITGHSHRRCYVQLDDAAASMEAGHYLDTVGFASMQMARKTTTTSQSVSFRYAFLDATRESLIAALGMRPSDHFDTAEGLALTKLIQTTRQDLQLDDVVGCNPIHYFLDRDIADSHSLWRLYLGSVVPAALTDRANRNHTVFVQSTGGLRYDLWPGYIHRDDLIAVSPFDDTVCSICQGLTSDSVRSILRELNRNNLPTTRKLPLFASTLDVVATIDATADAMRNDNITQLFDLFGIEFDFPAIAMAAKRVGQSCSPAVKQSCVQQSPFWTTTDMWFQYYAAEQHQHQTRYNPGLRKHGDSPTQLSFALFKAATKQVGNGILPSFFFLYAAILGSVVILWSVVWRRRRFVHGESTPSFGLLWSQRHNVGVATDSYGSMNSSL